MRKPRRGDVWLVNSDPTLGAEIRKTRPALILQNDVANEHSPITIVAAITSTPRLTPTRVHVAATECGLRVDSVVELNQICSVGRHLKTGHHSGGCRAPCSRQRSLARTARAEISILGDETLGRVAHQLPAEGRFAASACLAPSLCSATTPRVQRRRRPGPLSTPERSPCS